MDNSKLQPGTRIYYTGDMANSEDRGVIIKRYSDRWGDFVDIKFDTGRISRRIYTMSFEPGAGCRFMFESEWQEQHDKAVEAFTKRYKINQEA